MCEDPQSVDNSEIIEVKSETLMSGETALSIYEYDCDDNYYIDDKSKMVIRCQSGSATWDITSLPVCLKGLFYLVYQKYEISKLFIFSL